MPEAAQWIAQGGAVAILAYLVWWTTTRGAPNLFEALGGIRSAVEANTLRTENLEKTTRELTYVVRRMAEKSGTVGDATMAKLCNHEKPRNPPATG